MANGLTLIYFYFIFRLIVNKIKHHDKEKEKLQSKEQGLHFSTFYGTLVLLFEQWVPHYFALGLANCPQLHGPSGHVALGRFGCDLMEPGMGAEKWLHEHHRRNAGRKRSGREVVASNNVLQWCTLCSLQRMTRTVSLVPPLKLHGWEQVSAEKWC